MPIPLWEGRIGIYNVIIGLLTIGNPPSFEEIIIYGMTYYTLPFLLPYCFIRYIRRETRSQGQGQGQLCHTFLKDDDDDDDYDDDSDDSDDSIIIFLFIQ